MVVEYLEQERHRFTEQRRQVYVAVGCIGIALVLYNTYTSLQSSQPSVWLEVANNLVYAVVAAVFVVLGLTRRVALEWLERALFVFLAVQSVVFNSLIPWFFNLDLAKVLAETINDDVWALVMVCALGLHLFERRTGLILGFGLYGLTLGIVAPYVALRLARGDSAAPVGVIAQTYFLGLMLLCFIFFLARYRESAQRISLQYEMLEGIAFLDALTGLPNRRRMYGTLEAQISLAERYGTPFAVVLLDLDHFKAINDRFGHVVGDRALVRVAETARRELRTTDALGRWGGEEFLLVLPQTGLEEAAAVADRVREAVAAIADLADGGITLSGGLAVYRPGDDGDRLTQRADRALYEAKGAGRDRVALEDGPILRPDLGLLTNDR